MLDPQTSQFWKAGLQSGLLDADALTRCWEAIPPGKRDAADHIDRRLGRQAVHFGLLTLWQAQQLLAGRITGFRVDRYVLQDLIGQGGMGRVYLAQDTRLNRRVALKILSPERMNNPRAIARFQREAKVGAQLQHENLVRLYDFGESHGRHFLVMEFIEGRSLGFFIATEGRIPYALAARFGYQVALGLDHAHRKGLIHRDVNPYNVIVTNEGVAKLADMGLAIDLADEGRVTRDGATVGTFDYVAPEQARHSHSADIRSDIYSLGCSLYHMISGQVPFPYPSLAEKLFAHQSQEPASLAAMTPGLPPGLVDVIAKMMQKKPDDRYQTPLELALALRPFAENSSSDPDPALAALGQDAGASEDRAEVLVGDLPTSTTGGSDGGGASSAEFSLGLEIPPEPLLTESPRTPKAWFSSGGGRSASSSGTSPGPSGSETNVSPWKIAAGPHGRRRRLLAGALMLGVAILAGFAYTRARRSNSALDPGSARESSSTIAGADATKAKTPEIDWGASSFAVLGTDGKARAEPDLSRAMEAALGSKGVVVLKGGEPIELKAGEGIRLTGRGTVQLQGAGEAIPVLKVDLNGKSPFLSLGSSAKLILKNLIIEVHRSGETGDASQTPPLILAAGGCELDQCELRTAPAVGYAGSCAIRADGSGLHVERCLFQGFDAAVEIHALAGSSHLIRNSIFVPGQTPAEAVKAGKPVRTGWTAKVCFEGGGRKDGSRSLRIERCTVSGEGLIQLLGFSDRSKIDLEVVSTAVKGDRVLDWRPNPPESPLSPAVVAWKGEGNQLDILGDSWISGSSDAPTIASLDSWSALFPESEPVRTAIRFAMGPSTPDGRLSPQAYSILDAHATGPGANPAEIGPR